MSVTVHDVSSDGHWGVIEAKDFPTTGAMGRSETRDSVHEAMASTSYDPARVIPPGARSQHKFVKVAMGDLAKLGLLPVKDTSLLTSLKPGDYAKVPRGGKKYIPDYPHTCPACGGKMLNLFTSQEHEGKLPCPGAVSKATRRARA